MKSDDSLVREAQAGSRAAFAELISRYEATLQTIARARLGHAEDARDVAQQAVAKAFTSISTLSDPSRVRAWFGRIVQNLCTDEMRRRRRPLPSNAAVRVTSVPHFDEELLSILDPLPRTLITLRFVNDLTYAEIAEWVDLPQNRVKWELHGAFDKLRKRMVKE